MQTLQQQQKPALVFCVRCLRLSISINVLLRRRRAAIAQT